MPIRQLGGTPSAPSKPSAPSGSSFRAQASSMMVSRIAKGPLAAQQVQPQRKVIATLGKKKLPGAGGMPAPGRPKAGELGSSGTPASQEVAATPDASTAAPASPPTASPNDYHDPGPSGGGASSSEQSQSKEDDDEAQGPQRYVEDDAQSQPQEQETQEASQEQAQQDGQTLAGVGEESDEEPETDIRFVSSHIANGCLNTIGICNTKNGYIPISSVIKLPGRAATISGPVDFGAEESSTLATALEKTIGVLYTKAKNQEQETAAQSLVDRARAGDQNAMAMIAVVRKNARAGHVRAQNAFKALRRYIERNPVDSDIGYEVKKPDTKLWARVWLANGPELNAERVKEFAYSFGNEDERKQFLYGCIKYRQLGNSQELAKKYDEMTRKLIEIGRTIGEAHALQKVRMPGSRISDFCPITGWELGE